jgi:hypothetical protein
MIVQKNVESNSEKASEMTPEASASEKVTLESSQHHEPEPQNPSPEKTTSPPQQQPTVPEPSVPEQAIPQKTVPEHIVPEQPVTKPIHEPESIPEPVSETAAPEHNVLESTPASITSSLVQAVKITHYTGVCDMDRDSEDD